MGTPERGERAGRKIIGGGGGDWRLPRHVDEMGLGKVTFVDKEWAGR